MGIFKYIDFLNEQVQLELNKIACVISKGMGPNSHSYITEPEYTVKSYMNILSQNKEIKVLNIPILNYCDSYTNSLIELGQPRDMIYNLPEFKSDIDNKTKWHKIHQDNQHIPKTAYTAEDAKNLNFPIIAKPNKGAQGKGIVKINNIKELDSADHSKFSLYSEKIDIKEEHRIFMWKNKTISWLQRIPKDDTTKNMSKKANAKLKFKYALVKQEVPLSWAKICESFSEKHPNIDMYTVDFMIDVNDKVWVTEMNTLPGTPFGIMGHYYKKVYEDYYGKPLSKGSIAILEEYIKKDIDATIKSDPKRFSISEHYGTT